MGDALVSRIPQLLQQKGMSDKEFIARCMLADLSDYTARRLLSGETNLTTNTMLKVAKILDVNINELIAQNGEHGE